MGSYKRAFVPLMLKEPYFTALQHLRKVVKLLDKENVQFRRDCENKMSFQKKQEERFREENERLRIKVNDMARPKVSVIAQMEERQMQLSQQVDVYVAKIDLDSRHLEDLEKVGDASSLLVQCPSVILPQCLFATPTSPTIIPCAFHATFHLESSCVTVHSTLAFRVWLHDFAQRAYISSLAVSTRLRSIPAFCPTGH